MGNEAISVRDIQSDPWCVLNNELPRDVDHQVLYVGYQAAYWCRQMLLSRLNYRTVHSKAHKTILQESDLALRRMREINFRLRELA